MFKRSQDQILLDTDSNMSPVVSVDLLSKFHIASENT